VTSRIQRWKIPFWKNPVLVKEFQTRMRGNRAFLLFIIHLFILGAIIALFYIVFKSSLSSTSAFRERRFFGKAIFGLIVWVEMVTVSFIAPALTSGAISSERERSTFDLLRVTLLPARSLVIGKYLSGIVFILLLLFTSIPLQSLAFLVGGVLLEEIVIASLILLVTAVAFCAIGIFFSSLLPRTLVSTVLSYALAIFLVFGVPMIFMIVLMLFGALLGDTYNALDPIMKTSLVFLGWILVSATPLPAMIATEAMLLDQQNFLLASLPIANGVQVNFLSPWILYVLIYILLSVVLICVSIQLAKKRDQ
jgi:ABC-type transport system involved in multi-copper enzyme maturation permease subunit